MKHIIKSVVLILLCTFYGYSKFDSNTNQLTGYVKQINVLSQPHATLSGLVTGSILIKFEYSSSTSCYLYIGNVKTEEGRAHLALLTSALQSKTPVAIGYAVNPLGNVTFTGSSLISAKELAIGDYEI